MKYKVVKITNDIQGCPECRKDTKQYPHLVKYVESKIDLFIVDETGNFWLADQFFYRKNVTEFNT